MTKIHISKVKTTIAASILFSLLAGTYMIANNASVTDLIGAAHAAEAKGNKAGKGKGGAKKGGAGTQGKRSGKKSVSDILAEDDGEDSDRPVWAGVPGKDGKPGGGNAGDTRKKGGDYGDIWIVLRNDLGLPVLDANGNVQPCLDPACTTYIQLTADGELPPEYVGKTIEVEFGRLNIARSPAKVLTHSLEEALSKLDGGIYGTTVTLDPAGRLTIDGSTIDSPLESLALYSALLTTPAVNGIVTLSITVSNEGGGTSVYTFSVPESDRLDLAASAFAAASDKTGTLSVSSVVGISGFLTVDDELASLVSNYTYDRTATYTGVQVWVLVETSPGIFEPKLVNVLDVVQFNTIPTIDGDNNGIDRFTQAADDALQVLEYVHDNAIDQ